MTRGKRTQEQLLATLQRLIAMEESSNENEAAVATVKANKILLEHNLTRQQVSDWTATKEYDEMVRNDETEIGRKDGWQLNLLDVIAKFSLCQIVTLGKRPNGSTIVSILGHKDNVDAVRWIFVSVAERLGHLANGSFREYVKANPHGEKRGKYRRGFLFAAGRGVYDQLDLARKIATADQKALVVTEGQIVTQFVAKQFKHLRTKKRGLGTSGRDGRIDGKRAGQHVDVTPGTKFRPTTQSASVARLGAG